jgi:uncharacterized phage infection (PIP) family protein YhgE
MIAIAVLGLVVSLVGTVVGWQLVGDLDRGVGQSLELTGEVLVTVDESFTIAEDALEILTAGVDEAESAVRSLSRSLEEGEDALASATALTGDEIADALESVERSLPDVEAAANAIDDALRTLDALPLPFDYDPERPLGDTIGDLRTDLRELPDELREQAAQVELMSQELSAATAGARATADALAQLEDRLGAASELIADYALSTGDARVLVDEQRDVLATSVRRARALGLSLSSITALAELGDGSCLAMRPRLMHAVTEHLRTVRQQIALRRGLTSEQAKEISKIVRDKFPKVKPVIQGDALRVSGAKKDDLQAVIAFLRSRDFGAAVNFKNFRD